MISAVVFDMDGVLLDTEPVSMECWRVAIEQLGLPFHRQTIVAGIGRTAKAMEELLYAQYGASFPYPKAREVKQAEFVRRVVEGTVPVKPGAQEILKALKQRGCPLALATSSPRFNVEPELRRAGLLDSFDKVICGEEITRGKPDPEIYSTACKLLGAAPAAAYAVEDSFAGVRSAHAAGMRVIMVPDTIAPDADMQRLADVILPSLADAQAYLMERMDAWK